MVGAGTQASPLGLGPQGAVTRVSAGLVVLATAMAAVGCSASEEQPAAAPTSTSVPTSPASSAPPAAAPPVAATVATKVGVGHVAGRLGERRRQQVKAAVTAVVDRYVDQALVAGPWPRDDFSAAFADFRRGAARDAAGRDLDLLTQHAVGATTGAVSAIRRRLRIDVLAPDGRARGATGHFAVDLSTTSTTPGAAPGAVRVAGSLYLTRERGAWKVFGYDVRQERS